MNNHPEPSTEVVYPSKIAWRPGIPAEPGLFFFTWEGDKIDGHPKTVTVEDRGGSLFFMSAEVDFGGPETGAPLGVISERFKNPQYAPKQEPTVNKANEPDPNAKDKETPKADFSAPKGEGDPDTREESDQKTDAEPVNTAGKPVKKTTVHVEKNKQRK